MKSVTKRVLMMLLSIFYFWNMHGQIPADYKGTPYLGKPQVIPGRVEFEFHDDGGMGVGFRTDYIAEGPIKDYRPLPHISVDETNTGINVDKYFDGTLYPSAANPHSYYAGWTHVNDMSRFTVNVLKSDDYYISSTFAQGEEVQVGFSLTINGDVANKKKIVLDYGTGGGWHTWKKFDKFTTVHLNAGLNLIEFWVDIHHVNYDYLEFIPVHPVVDQKLTSITVSPSTTSVGLGNGVDFNAQGIDQYGNPIAITESWSVSGGGSINTAGLFTGSTIGGPYTVTASVGAISGTAVVNVTAPATLAKIVVTPATSTTTIGNPVDFNAQGFDINNQPMVINEVWTVSGGGTISATGLFTPTTAGTFTVTAKSGLISGIAQITATAIADDFPKDYKGIPFKDAVYNGAPQVIPGKLQNEYYDMLDVSNDQKKAGIEEGICYGDNDNANSGSGTFNGTGTYNKEFRMFESPDISYTKFEGQDNSEFNIVMPDKDALYLGWIYPNEWVNYTVNVTEAGYYSLDIMYTSKFGGHISIDCNGKALTGPLEITTTYDAKDPIEWRQAHHWNKMKKVGNFYLSTGKKLLTLKFLDQPVFNFDYMEFVKVSPPEEQILTSIAVTPATASVGLGSSVDFNAQGIDQFGKPMPVAETWTVSGGGSIDASGLFTGSAIGGPYTITASVGSKSGTAQVSVSEPPVLHRIIITPATISITESSTVAFNAISYDQFGYPFPIAVVWSVSGGGTINSTGLFTGTTIGGPYTVKATSGTISGTAAVTVTAAPVSQIIQAESYATMNGVQKEATTDEGGGQNVGYIDNGDWMTYAVNIPKAGNYSVNFRVAGWAATGRIALQNAENVTLSAANVPNNGGYQKWSTVAGETTFALEAGAYTFRIYAVGAPWNLNWFELKLIEPSVLKKLVLSPENVTIVQDEQVCFKLTGYDQYGKAMPDVIYPDSWITPCGTLSAYGCFFGSEPGTCTFTAIKGAISATATVITLPKPILKTITVAPTTVNLTVGQTKQFTAIGKDNNDAIVTISPVWAVSGGGTISQTGLFTATTVGTPFIVSASVGAIAGNAALTVDPAPSVIHIEAESYINMNGVQKEPTTDAGGGQNVGYIDNGDWMTYTVNIPVTGNYSADFRVAGWAATGKIELQNAAFAKLTGIDVPNSGGYQVWKTVTGANNFSLSVGTQTIRIYAAGAPWNLNWIELKLVAPSVLTSIAVTPAPVTLSVGATQQFTATGKDQYGNVMAFTPTWNATGGTISTSGLYTAGAAIGTFSVSAQSGAVVSNVSVVTLINTPITTRIQAETFAAQFGTQTEACTDLGGGQDVGYVDPNDWLDYPVTIPSSGVYTISFRLACALGTGSFQLKSGANVLASVTVPNTGGWQNWQTVNVTANLTAGAQTLRIAFTGIGCNINWWEYTQGLKSAEEFSAVTADFNVFPNPATDMVTIEANNADFNVVEIHSITGALMISEPILGPVTEINLSELKNGLYLISLKGNTISTKKLIKQ
jgi:hypothetical protein